MLNNINYNLLETITIISRSLYRYNTYMEDASKCKSCQITWQKLKEEREKELLMLLKELKIHIDLGELILE